MPRVPAPGRPQEYVRVIKTEEKGSDVNLATHLLHGAHMGRFEVAVGGFGPGRISGVDPGPLSSPPRSKVRNCSIPAIDWRHPTERLGMSHY